MADGGGGSGTGRWVPILKSKAGTDITHNQVKTTILRPLIRPAGNRLRVVNLIIQLMIYVHLALGKSKYFTYACAICIQLADNGMALEKPLRL